ncbi:MAG: hypothetical protein KGQ50_01510 [Bacteroidetes bacterium]|nr:hypothetical protein [Bacteroidota bacterium]
MKKLFVVILMFELSIYGLQGQGCVAIRGVGSCLNPNSHAETGLKGSWTISGDFRYFKSFRHFRGHEEEADRVANGTEVINHTSAFNIGVQHGLTERLFFSSDIPFVINTRSSLYEHGRKERRTTFSRGLGDIRLGLGYWLVEPGRKKHALAAGFSVKLPTGNYQALDIFYNVGVNGSSEIRPVDQSIQPGDGGFGISIDFQYYQALFSGITGYVTGFYLANPREMNGVRTFRETLSPVLKNESIMSVSDQFSYRAGLMTGSNRKGISGIIGARYEGVPVRDIIGGSLGFRRPGSILSVEPGISYMKGGTNIQLSIPIAIRRNRPQSVTDIETTAQTGQFRNGDAAFADYLINLRYSLQLSKKK